MDRLSDLPDALVHRIFSFMPSEDVVRTSVLSKRWNGLWLTTPTLFFGTNQGKSGGFINFINRTLILRGTRKINCFRITLFLNRGYSRDLDLWVRYALQNDVERLMLDLRGDIDSFYIPPQFLYRCSTVRSLTLSMCRIWLRKSVSWTSLESLRLRHVIVFRHNIQEVLSGCPKLELLELAYCEGYDGLSTDTVSLKKLIIAETTPDMLDLDSDNEQELEISAPNIKSLHMSGELWRKCSLIQVSSLVHATLSFHGKLYKTDGFHDRQDWLLEVLGSLEHVENLTLGEWCIKALAINEKKGLPPRPLKCKYLTLNSSLKQEDVLGILHILKCSTNLETLTLNVTSPEFDEILYESKVGILVGFCNFAGEHYLISQANEINCLSLHLKTIRIAQFVDQHLVLPLIGFLLREARVLKNMEIRAKTSHSSPESQIHAAQKLLDMPRSSPNAVVKLLSSSGKVTVTIA